MNADGISYLDIGDACLRGGWKNAINLIWSPLYPWLMGAARGFVVPSPRWEFLFVYLGALAKCRRPGACESRRPT